MAVRKGPKEWTPEPGAVRDVMYSDTAQCLAIAAPRWFERPDFQEWRRGTDVATWHEPSWEGQDVFIVYADGELDWHTKGMPRDIERTVLRLIEKHEMEYGVVWIKAV